MRGGAWGGCALAAGLFRTKAGLFVDLFLLLLLALLPAMLVGVALVRRGRVRAHAAVMVTCFVLFLVGVVAFEVQVQFGERYPMPPGPLVIHLCFAVPSLLLWVRQVATARRALLEPAAHRRRGRVLLALLSFTVATGFWLYAATFL
jgi:uncharacterized membrane protein YozB (DUF420 family)